MGAQAASGPLRLVGTEFRQEAVAAPHDVDPAGEVDWVGEVADVFRTEVVRLSLGEDIARRQRWTTATVVHNVEIDLHNPG